VLSVEDHRTQQQQQRTLTAQQEHAHPNAHSNGNHPTFWLTIFR
jgi:hypothetical protein